MVRTDGAYRYYVQMVHANVAYRWCVQILVTDVTYTFCVQMVLTNIAYRYYVQMVRTKIPYKWCVHMFACRCCSPSGAVQIFRTDVSYGCFVWMVQTTCSPFYWSAYVRQPECACGRAYSDVFNFVSWSVHVAVLSLTCLCSSIEMCDI